MDDRVLPIARTSRRVVPVLQRDGYLVDYREFQGGHLVSPDLAEQAADCWCGSRRTCSARATSP